MSTKCLPTIAFGPNNRWTSRGPNDILIQTNVLNPKPKFLFEIQPENTEIEFNVFPWGFSGSKRCPNSIQRYSPECSAPNARYEDWRFLVFLECFTMKSRHRPLCECAQTNRKWTVSVGWAHLFATRYEKADTIPGQAGGTPRACAIHTVTCAWFQARCRVSSRAFEILAPCHS